VLISKKRREARKLRELGKRVEQSPNQITQILAQSPAVDELLKRDRSYSVIYSNSARLRLCKPANLAD